MGSFLSLLHRNWKILFPPQPAKERNALRIGLLGASNIAYIPQTPLNSTSVTLTSPLAIILPSKSHPEVIVAAIAARDPKRAAAYAKKHSIPIAHPSYEALISDPSIDVVYIPLPNGLHYEWALKSLRAGKHVLLEKPSVSNATEALSLFRSPLLSAPNAPVLLEAFHSRFHPALQHFLSLLTPSKIESAHSRAIIPRGAFPPSDIRFVHSLSGGCGMDVGTYQLLFLRLIFASEPVETLSTHLRRVPEPYDQKCDQAMSARLRFPNGGVGSFEADLSARYTLFGVGIPSFRIPMCEAVHREEVVPDQNLLGGEEHCVRNTVRMWNPMMPTIWHRIDVITSHTIRSISTKKVLRKWEVKESVKAHGTEGKESWLTYRYQLEAFVDRIRGRNVEDRVWMSGEESISQMRAVDSVYVRSGLGIRPTSEACLREGGE